MGITFKPIYLEQNTGHGNSMRVSMQGCRNDLVAIMDADNISTDIRFEKQARVFRKSRMVDVVGGQITEFVGESDNITGKRCVPETDNDIKRYLKKRCPMNHMTVMFRRSAVEKAGGYLDWYCNEDYYLWIRMAMAGSTFVNIPDTLCNVRVGSAMAGRRGGWKYFISEAGIQKFMLQNKLISFPRYLYNLAVRFGGEVVAPNNIRSILFRLTRCRYKERKEKVSNFGVSRNMDVKGEKEYPPFSVAMCVYGKDNAEWFDEALASVTIHQTVMPDEVVLVVDGPIPQSIQAVIDKYSKIFGKGLNLIYFKENQGFGNALKAAVENSHNEIIARMDSDDIAVPDRFRQQLEKFMED